MRKKIILFITLLYGAFTYGQAFDKGEWLRYRLSYSSFLKGGEVTLKISEDPNQKDGFHIKGKGETSGLVRLFFKVDDIYQTYIDKKTVLPYHFKRKINEGGYTKNVEIKFDQEKHSATVIDHKKNTTKEFKTVEGVQDMLSSIYSLRNQDLTHLTKGDEITQHLFFDNENYIFKLRFLGKEFIKTQFGKVKCLKFMPIVQQGRLFKSKESLTIWISDDKNKIPLKIQASLAVGSLRAELNGFKKLKNPFNITF
ncbi:MAG: DUF3108 domain-containing protein [Flavobacteriaceae bacterium]|nr:DUF3108 domain-containing protein [Flavobacteriaceae bacterium]